MSFLEDGGATLDEALAFLDEFCAPSDAPSGRQSPREPRRPRVRDPTVYARRRERKKQELEALRSLARELERQLRAARRALPASPGGSTDSDGSSGDERGARWLAAARSELRRRVESERVNLQLRGALAAQVKLARVLQEAAAGLSGGGKMDAELVERPSDSIYSAMNVANITEELRATTERLFEEVMATKDATDADAVVSESSIKVDPVVGKYAESKSAAPLGKSFTAVMDMLMEQFWQLKFPVTASVNGEDIREKRHDQNVTVDGADVRFHCIGVVSKRVVNDCLVVTHANLLFHPSGNLCFRVGGWFLLKKSRADENLCVFRSCSRLAPDVCGDPSAVDKASLKNMQSGAMAALGAASKRKHQNIQRRLLVETGREDLALLLPLDDGSFDVPVPAA